MEMFGKRNIVFTGIWRALPLFDTARYSNGMFFQSNYTLILTLKLKHKLNNTQLSVFYSFTSEAILIRKMGLLNLARTSRITYMSKKLVSRAFFSKKSAYATHCHNSTAVCDRRQPKGSVCSGYFIGSDFM